MFVMVQLIMNLRTFSRLTFQTWSHQMNTEGTNDKAHIWQFLSMNMCTVSLLCVRHEIYSQFANNSLVDTGN